MYVSRVSRTGFKRSTLEPETIKKLELLQEELLKLECSKDSNGKE